MFALLQDVVSTILDNLIMAVVPSNQETQVTSDINTESGEESIGTSSTILEVDAGFVKSRKRKKKESESTSSESSFLLQLDTSSTDSSSIADAAGFGKGKRKRFQNVRMLPIE